MKSNPPEYSQILGQLWEAHRNRLLAIAGQILENRQDAEDAVSEAFVRLSSNIGKYRELDESQLLALLITITKNVSRDKLRARRELVSFEDYEPVELASVEETALSDENVRTIRQEVENLGSTYRDVVRLRLYEEKSFREISGDLGISESAARKRYQRGMEILRKRLLILLLILLSCLLLLGLSRRPIREAFGSWISCSHSDYVTVYMSSESADYPEEIDTRHEPTYGVQDYEKAVQVDSSVWYSLLYTADGKENISYMQYTADTFRYTDVGKDCLITGITINGYDGLYLWNKNCSAIIWTDDEYTYCLSGSLSEDEMIRIAQSTK